jgi:hypothetical protein
LRVTSAPVSTISVPVSGGTSGRSASSGKSTDWSSRNFPVGVASEASIDSCGAHFVSAWYLGFVHGAVLGLFGFGVTIEVEINHYVPLGFSRSKGAAETEDLAGEHPPDETNGVTAFVICRDCNVDEFCWGVCIAESNDGDIDVTGFFNSLSIGTRIRDDDKAGFFEGARDIIGEVTRGETTGDGYGSGVCGELEYGSLAVRAGGDDANVGWIIDCRDDAGCENNFFPIEKGVLAVGSVFNNHVRLALV